MNYFVYTNFEFILLFIIRITNNGALNFEAHFLICFCVFVIFAIFLVVMQQLFFVVGFFSFII